MLTLTPQTMKPGTLNTLQAMPDGDYMTLAAVRERLTAVEMETIIVTSRYKAGSNLTNAETLLEDMASSPRSSHLFHFPPSPSAADSDMSRSEP